MPDATTTPVDPAAAPAIREEITQRTDALRLALTHLTDQVAKATHESAAVRTEIVRLSESVDGIPGLVRRLHELEADRILGAIAADRAKDRKALVELVAQERIDRDKAIAASEVRTDAKIAAALATVTAEVDHRIDRLELRIGKALKERDSIDEEITGTVKLTIERVDTLAKDHEETKTRLGRVVAWIDDNKGKLGIGVGGTGLGIAVASAAPHVGDWIKSLLEIFK